MESHLLQMRGLKPCGWCVNCRQNKSHLLQMRGLKPSGTLHVMMHGVASFTDAWIETCCWMDYGGCGGRRIFYRCVD